MNHESWGKVEAKLPRESSSNGSGPSCAPTARTRTNPRAGTRAKSAPNLSLSFIVFTHRVFQLLGLVLRWDPVKRTRWNEVARFNVLLFLRLFNEFLRARPKIGTSSPPLLPVLQTPGIVSKGKLRRYEPIKPDEGGLDGMDSGLWLSMRFHRSQRPRGSTRCRSCSGRARRNARNASKNGNSGFRSHCFSPRVRITKTSISNELEFRLFHEVLSQFVQENDCSSLFLERVLKASYFNPQQ